MLLFQVFLFLEQAIQGFVDVSVSEMEARFVLGLLLPVLPIRAEGKTN